jgi:sugar phosphate isomerase/epimerase
VQLSDAVGGGMPGLGRAVPLGKGTVDFATILAALEQRDYRGYFTVCESGPPNRGNASGTRAGELAEAIQFIRRL